MAEQPVKVANCLPARKADQLPASNIDQGRTVI
jgi:hypothetical protein